MRRSIALGALVLSLVIINLSIAGKEKHLTEGDSVYLQLAPVDPRSLMQGDYMALNFVIANELISALPKVASDQHWRRAIDAANGFAVVTLNKQKVATFTRLFEGGKLAENERLLFYRVRSGKVKFATNAFFFQEGDAGLYESARYGEFRVDKRGEMLLIAMYDESLNRLGDE